MPWSNETWFWPAYELYFSHYGVHVSLLILLLPLGVWWARRHLDPVVRAELTGISVSALVLVGLNLLIGLRPYGGFAFIPRFLFFALPVLLVWTWCPGVKYFQQIRRIVVAAARGLAGHTDCVHQHHRHRESVLAPRVRATALEGSRVAPGDSTIRRGERPRSSIVSRGPMPRWRLMRATTADKPAYGAGISRSVQVILGNPIVPPGSEVQWVAVDRAFSKVWGHPDLP